MKYWLGIIVLAVGLVSGKGSPFMQAYATEVDDVRAHADQSFDRLNLRRGQQESIKEPGVIRQAAEAESSGYPSDQYWIGRGLADLGKGKMVCQRVSELAARTDLAKQIRVMVKERLVDRVRERSGREPEQDLELTREEIVEEYLQGVKIVERGIDEDKKTCTATAVMLKSPLKLDRGNDPDPAPSLK